ncbi:exodeoxyribonuclease VII small subunit [Lancefieldella rimae]|uniref:exodeoxyribonuclease VII small subunit n=1 Tax=Lancefieldella rimae TaxID=1383 RepID=UPI003A90AF84
MAEKDIKDLTFKDASVELEQIVRQLEGSDLELEESLALYTRGVELVKDLRGRLDTAEQKVRVLLDASEVGSAISDTTAAPSTAYVNE